MSENKMPEFDSIEELTEFFDTEDMGKYLDEMPEVHFDVDIKRRRFLIPVDEQLMKQLSQVAKSQRTSTQNLVNKWLKEKVAHAAQGKVLLHVVKSTFIFPNSAKLTT